VELEGWRRRPRQVRWRAPVGVVAPRLIERSLSAVAVVSVQSQAYWCDTIGSELYDQTADERRLARRGWSGNGDDVHVALALRDLISNYRDALFVEPFRNPDHLRHAALDAGSVEAPDTRYSQGSEPSLLLEALPLTRDPTRACLAQQVAARPTLDRSRGLPHFAQSHCGNGLCGSGGCSTFLAIYQ